MIEYIILITIIIYFTIASIEDIRKREVYDYINFSLAFFVLSAAIFDSLIIESMNPIKYASFGMLIGFGIGAILFYMGIWGGGDAKFLLGFGAASYYLLNFLNTPQTGIGEVYQYAMLLLSDFFALTVELFLFYLIIIDFIFVIFVIFQYQITKRKDEKRDLIFLLAILFLMLIGLYFEYKAWQLVGLGFLAFFLIFIAKEGLFSSVYFKYKKSLKDLKEYDKIDSDIKIGHKIIVEYEKGRLGLSKEEIHKIQSNITNENRNYEVLVRKSLPYGMLISLNYVLFMFKIIILDNITLSILSYMFKFMFLSFMAGGVIAILIVFYYYFKNHSKVKMKLSRNEIIILSMLFLSATSLIFLIDKKFYIIFWLIPIYIFIKMAKSIEQVAFIKKKELSQIVLGDWIVQDIKVDGKIIYHKEDFKIGVEEHQLAKIKKLDKTHSNLDKILVKDGIAFLPALYLGFLLMFLI